MVAVEFAADQKSRRFFDLQAQPHRNRRWTRLCWFVRCPMAKSNSLSPLLCITRNYDHEVVERYGRALHRAMPEPRQLAG